MPINYNDTDTINDYLDGNMDENTSLQFKEELSKNAELAEQVEWHQNFKEALILAEKESLQQRTRELIAEKKKQQAPNQTKVFSLKTFWQSNNRYIAVAAMLLIAFALTFLLSTPKSESTLVAQHLSKPHSPPITTRSSADADWIDAYKNTQYAQASQFLSQQEQDSLLNAEQKFYLGLTYLYQKGNQSSKAIRYLNAAKQENPTLYKDNSNWYIALAYLKNQQKEEAKKYLQEIVATKSWKHKEAQELLNAL